MRLQLRVQVRDATITHLGCAFINKYLWRLLCQQQSISRLCSVCDMRLCIFTSPRRFKHVLNSPCFIHSFLICPHARRTECQRALHFLCSVMLTSAYAFQALALYCSRDVVSLPGFAKHFYKESLQQQHAFFQIAAFLVRSHPRIWAPRIARSTGFHNHVVTPGP